MGRIWMDTGFIRWPLTFSLLVVIGLALYTAKRVFSASGEPAPEIGVWVDSTLFWGAFAFLIGILGTLVGIIQAAQAIEMSGGEIAPSLIWGGLKVAMISSVLGTLILGFASLIWFGLRFKLRMRMAGEDQAAMGV